MFIDRRIAECVANNLDKYMFLCQIVPGFEKIWIAKAETKYRALEEFIKYKFGIYPSHVQGVKIRKDLILNCGPCYGLADAGYDDYWEHFLSELRKSLRRHVTG